MQNELNKKWWYRIINVLTWIAFLLLLIVCFAAWNSPYDGSGTAIGFFIGGTIIIYIIRYALLYIFGATSPK